VERESKATPGSELRAIDDAMRAARPNLPVMKRLDSLECWKAARRLALTAYRLTLEPPLNRHFSLADQIRMAAPSIPANIAEGYSLTTRPQFVRCLRIALGSATELRTHLELVQELELSPANATADALAQCDRLIGLIVGLIQSLIGRT
jgi:four helix bundle protein